MLLPFGMFRCRLLYFSNFGKLLQGKSGNPGRKGIALQSFAGRRRKPVCRLNFEPSITGKHKKVKHFELGGLR
jgi:hypothetical protein